MDPQRSSAASPYANTPNAATPSAASSSSSSSAPPSVDKIIKELMHKISQIVVRARIPAHAELEKNSAFNRWFNLQLPEWAGVRGEMDVLLRTPMDGASGTGSSSSSMSSSALMSNNPAGGMGSTLLKDVSPVPSAVVQLDILLRNAKNYSQYVLIERWNIQHERASDLSTSTANAAAAASKKIDPSSMYKKLLILVRSLYSFVKLMPGYHSWRLGQICLERKESCGFNVQHQLSSSEKSINYLYQAGLLQTAAAGGVIYHPVFDQTPKQFTFNSVATPIGKFTLSVFYRPELTSIEFLPSNSLLSSARLVGGGSSTSATGSANTSDSAQGQTATMHLAAGSEQIIIQDYMTAPETNAPNPSHRMSGTNNNNGNNNNFDPHSNQQQQNMNNNNMPVAVPVQTVNNTAPKSALAWGLERERIKRENSGNVVNQPQGFTDERRHTLPPNQPLFNDNQTQSFQNQQQQQQQHARTDRAQSVMVQGGTSAPYGGGMLAAQGGGRSRGESDSSDSTNQSASTTSKPMSIPRGSVSGNANPNAPHSLPTQVLHASSQQLAQQQQQASQQHHHQQSASHSPSSDPPSFNNSFTPPVHSTPHSYGSSIGGATAYSPAIGGGYLQQAAQGGNFSSSSSVTSIPKSYSGQNLEKLLEEDTTSEEERFAFQHGNGHQQQLYDHTPSGSQHLPPSNSGGSMNRLPHSQSQPMGFGSSPSANNSRRNSLTSPSSEIGVGSFKGSSNKPPLSSSRVTTSFSPSLGPASPATPSTIVIREREAAASPFATSSVGGRFVAFPPPVLGSNVSPSSSGLALALQQQQQQINPNPQLSSPVLIPMNSSNKPPTAPSAGSPHQSRIIASPSSSPTLQPSVPPFTSGSGGSSTRAIPIPSKPSTGGGNSSGNSAAGSLFGRTPPFASGGTGSLTTTGSFINTGSVTALGLMKGGSVSSSPPTYTTSMVPGADGGRPTTVAVGSWQGSDAPIQLSVNPFRAPNSASSGRKSISSSPSIQPQQVRIAPQMMAPFDLGQANVSIGLQSHHDSHQQSQHLQVPSATQLHAVNVNVPQVGTSSVSSGGGHHLPFDASPIGDADEGIGGGFGFGDGDANGDGEAALGKFLSYISELQQSSQPTLQLFQQGSDDPASTSSTGGAAPVVASNNTSASPVPPFGSASQTSFPTGPAAASIFGAATVTSGARLRQTSVQSLFDQLDQLSLSAAHYAQPDAQQQQQ